MSVCVSCVHTHTRAHACTRTHRHAHKHAHARTHTCMRTHTHTHAHMHIYTHTCAHRNFAYNFKEFPPIKNSHLAVIAFIEGNIRHHSLYLAE